MPHRDWPQVLWLLGLAFALGCSEPAATIAPAVGAAGSAGALAGSGGSGGGQPGLGGGDSAGSGGTGGAASGGTLADPGGSGGGGMSGAGGATPSALCEAGDCSAFLGSMDGFLFEYPCAAGGGCSGEMCVDGQLTITQSFVIMGDPSKVYEIAFRVRGVTESKNYEGGMRRSMASIDPSAAGGDLWYEGGTAPLSTYSSYELHVQPAVVAAPNDYYLNARDGSDEHDGTTWGLNYSAAVLVNGGGSITFKTFDSNCSAIRNCGPKGTSPCTPRTFDLSDAVPAPSATQPILDDNATPVQWLHIDVSDVAVKN